MIITCRNCGIEFRRSPSLVRSASNFCSRGCGYDFRRPAMQGFAVKANQAQKAKLKTTAVHRFWSRVAAAGQDECWEWQGARLLSGGYGVTCWDGKLIRAHRLALALTDGVWDDRRPVCHTCDNPPCCNPSHLWRGTDAENAKDRDSKGRTRQAPLKTHCPQGHEYTADNTYTRKADNSRQCRACARMRGLEAYYNNHEANKATARVRASRRYQANKGLSP